MLRTSDMTTKSAGTGSTSSTTNTSTSESGPNYQKRSKSVSYGRLVFVAFLMGVAIAMGYLAHYLLTNTETNLVYEQYYSLVERGLGKKVFALCCIFCYHFSFLVK